MSKPPPLSLADVRNPLRAEDGGKAVRVGPTRVLLEIVLGSYLRGNPPEEIVRQFTSLNLADVYATIAYYHQNRREVDEYLAWCEEEAARVRAEIEARFPSEEWRERMLAHRAEAERQAS